jgi:hypothetical protein
MSTARVWKCDSISRSHRRPATQTYQQLNRYSAQDYYQHGPRTKYHERNETVLAEFIHLKLHGVQEQHQGQGQRSNDFQVGSCGFNSIIPSP